MQILAFLVALLVSSVGLCGVSVVLPGGEEVVLVKKSEEGAPSKTSPREGDSVGSCNVALKQGASTVWSTSIECQTSFEDAQLILHKLGGGRTAVHLKIPFTRTDKFSEYVFVRDRLNSSLKIVWNEETGLVGDLGERVSPMVRFQDLSGDGQLEIVAGTISEAVSLCGTREPPLLFRRVYDWKKGRFRSVLARRTGLGKPQEVVGIYLPQSAQTKPLVDQTVPLSVSRSIGDRGDPIFLAPPRALVDGDPSTAWMPAPRNGAGEFATLGTLAHLYGITRVGVRSLPAVKRPRKYDRPRSLFLKTEEGVYRLVFPSDPLGSPDKMVWFELPSPLHSRCLSLIVESSYAPSADSPLALAEIALITEADGPGGLLQLAEDLNDPKRRRQASGLLERAGSASVEAIRSVWKKLDLRGKQRAVSVVVGADPGAGVDILCEAVLLNEPELSQTALRGLKRAGDQAVPLLEKSLVSQSYGEFENVVQVLASLGTKRALDALAGQGGKGGRHRRMLLRKHLGQMGLAREENARRLFSLVREASGNGDREIVLDLARALALHPAWSGKLAPILDAMYAPSLSFADRYRLLELYGVLGCRGNRQHLLSSARDPDHHLRAVAIEGLGRCVKDRESALAIAGQGLRDPEVEVRLAALRTVGRLGASDSYRPVIEALATSDPWPDVRARSTRLAGDLPHKAILRILATTKNDASPLVRVATLKSVQGIRGEEANRIIEGFLARGEEESRIRVLAAGVAAKRCQKSAIPVLFEALKRGAEPLAESEDVDVAVAAARALGVIGGSLAQKYLTQAKRRSNPATDRAIERALSSRSNYCPVE